MCGNSEIQAAMRAKIAVDQANFREVTKSPFGPEDEIGMLNLLDDVSPAEVMRGIDGRMFDLAMDFFIGMPSWTAFGDPSFQMWMTHTPNGNVIDDIVGVGEKENNLVSYSSDSISMYSHTGTHVDALNHFGYNHEIWNGYREDKHLASRGWTKAGVDKHPPVVTRGVLVDVARSEGVDVLPPGFVIGPDELERAIKSQGVEIRPADVVLVRTGRAQLWPDPDQYIPDEPGLDRAGAEFLCKLGAIMIGADTAALEVRPSQDPENFHDVHTYLLAEAGVPILEIADLEDLAASEVHHFAFVGTALKIRGATGAPMRPIALPYG